MKLLKLIPAAAIALTSFATFEAKAMKICVYNNAGFDMRFWVKRIQNYPYSKATGYYGAGQTNCIKMSDIPVNVGQSYNVYYQWSTHEYGEKSSCAKNKTRQSSDSGTTKTYTVSGTTTNSSCEL